MTKLFDHPQFPQFILESKFLPHKLVFLPFSNSLYLVTPNLTLVEFSESQVSPSMSLYIYIDISISIYRYRYRYLHIYRIYIYIYIYIYFHISTIRYQIMMTTMENRMENPSLQQRSYPSVHPPTSARTPPCLNFLLNPETFAHAVWKMTDT